MPMINADMRARYRANARHAPGDAPVDEVIETAHGPEIRPDIRALTAPCH